MAAGYALLFLLVLQSPHRKQLPCLLFACAFGFAYNVGYDTFLHHRWITSLALFVRLLPPVEACRLCLLGRRDAKAALAIFLCAITLKTFSPDAVAAGYLTTRCMVTVSVSIVCALVWICDYLSIFQPEPFFAKHLVLQTVWMALHSLFSATSGWYNQTWQRRGVARWIYVGCSLALVLAYRQLLTSKLDAGLNPPAHPVE